MSHNPDDIGKLLAESRHSDVVIGSRYINGVNVVNWPLSRLILSYSANLYARIITGLPVTDATGGFKCFRRTVLESIDLSSINSEGYSFQIEMNFISWAKGYKIKEIPIIFSDFNTSSLIFLVSNIFLSSPFKILPDGNLSV